MAANLILLLLILTFAATSGMICVGSEQLLTLAQLAKRIPRRRRERPVHPSTVHRWRRPGIRGVRLECIRVGGAWHTSLEAFQRFCEQLSALEADTPPAPARAAEGARAAPDGRRQEQVERELEDLGT
jgi:hypothetical protein